MNLSRNHHYVPQGLLKRFCFTGSSLWYYAKDYPDKGIEQRNIKSVFKRKDYYNSTDGSGEKSDAAEVSFYGELDNSLSKFVDKVVTATVEGGTEQLCNEYKPFIHLFIESYMKRNPDFMSNIDSHYTGAATISTIIQEYEQSHGPIPPEVRDRIDTPARRNQLAENARIIAQTTTNTLASQQIAKMQIVIATAPETVNFIIGSNPVARFENTPHAKLGDGNVELWTPLTPKIALG